MKFEEMTEGDALAALEELEIDLIILTRKLRMELDTLQTQLVEQFGKKLLKFAESITSAFQVDSLTDYAQAAELFGTEFAGALYGVTVQFEQFRIGLIRTVQPIVQLLLPVVQVAVEVLSGLANALAQAVSWLFSGGDAADDFAGSMVGVSGSLKRTLAGFDQLNRLGGQSGGGGGILSIPKLSEQWQKVADRLTELMKPLKNIDLSPAAAAFEKLTQALEPLKKELFAGLEWAWNNLFVPLAQWTVEELLPVFLETLTAALQALNRVIEEIKPTLTWLWEECLKPLADWAGDRLIAYLENLTAQLTGVGTGAGAAKNPVDSLINSLNQFMHTLGNTLGQAAGLETMSQSLTQAMTGMMNAAGALGGPMGNLTTVFSGVANVVEMLGEKFGLVGDASSDTFQQISTTWSNLWGKLQEKMVDPTYAGMKQGINSMIGLTNGMLNATANGINGMTRSINKLSFVVPDWIPVLGGKRLGFNLQPVYPTQIPLLAQGAVLPANKPFMAIVGDQRHGTNIEAPLTTIQEAVDTVLSDRLDGVMAGFGAVTERQERILQALLSLDLSEAAIAGAADRYRSKLAVMTGGF